VPERLAFVRSEESDFEFDNVLPYPERFREMDQLAETFRKTYPNLIAPKDGYNSGGYHWCILNWGTKWRADEVSIQQIAETVELQFDTPWSPPLPVVTALSQRFPELYCEIEYREPDEGFSGTFSVKAGKVIEDTCNEG
jgi:hypothetical protein